MSNYTIVFIANDASKIAQVWSFVRKGLLAIKEKNRRVRWIPPQVHFILLQGRAELFLVLKGETPVGFFIGYCQPDPFLNVPVTYFIWLAYSVDAGGEGMDIAVQAVKERALTLGMENIEFVSPRPGWIQKIARWGFGVADVTYSFSLYSEEAHHG